MDGAKTHVSHRLQSVFERPIVVKMQAHAAVTSVPALRIGLFVLMHIRPSQQNSVTSVQYLLIKCLAQGHSAVSPCHEKT